LCFDNLRFRLYLYKNSPTTSLSIKVEMEDPDAVIAVYKKAQKIKGLITL